MAERFGCSVSELGQRLSHAEYLEWIAYYNYRAREKNGHEPLRDEQSEMQFNIQQMQKVLA